MQAVIAIDYITTAILKLINSILLTLFEQWCVIVR